MYVYRLRSLTHPTEIYIGVTGNLSERLKKHNAGGSIYTSTFAPWKIDFAIWLSDKDKALKLEKYLKSHSGRAFAAKHF